jgi:uncharacterized protein (DUF1499 family)
MRWLLRLALLVVIALAGLRIYLSRDEESRLRPGEAANFAHLELGQRDNVYLLCPGGPAICSEPADAVSPVFAMDVDKLRGHLLVMLATEKRLTLASEGEEGRRLVLIQRSPVLYFPDIITIELIPLEGGRSTLAILSRSRYGRYDFGVNAARVKAWMAKLEAAAAA